MNQFLVILINWNSGNTTVDCIRSLEKSTQKKFDLLIVDNGSKDGSIENLQNLYPKFHFIKNKKNEGFCGANNQALKFGYEKGYKYLILLNNDMVVHKTWFKNLQNEIRKVPRFGIGGGKILFKDYKPKIINSTGIVMNFLGYCYDRDFGKFDRETKRESEKVFAISGGFMVIHRDVIQMSGYLDEAYFAYYEDVEFCARMRRKTNLEIYYFPSSIVYHEFSGSSKKKPIFRFYLSIKNYWLNISKIFSLKMIIRLFPWILKDRIKNGILLQWRQKNFVFFLIEIYSLILFPLFILKNIFSISNKKFAEKYVEYMDQTFQLNIFLKNLENASGKKWDRS